jgi:hypothetical protein
LTHVNAVFNCCLDSISADIQYPRDPANVIAITEIEFADNPCDCLCLFDVDYTIPIIISGTYTIKVIGVHLGPQYEVLEVTIDLTEPISGEECIVRGP